jgi:hypothetical protein
LKFQGDPKNQKLINKKIIQLFNEYNCVAAFREGIHDASNATVITVNPTNTKSGAEIFTG